MAFALALLLASFASAQTCVLFDTSSGQARPVPFPCPDQKNRVRPLPIMHHCTVWQARPGVPGEYRSVPWAKLDELRRPQWDHPVSPDEDMKLFVARVDAQKQRWGYSPTPRE
jgi:hypothetical protein